MSTVERKEYQETKIMRTVSPVRHTRSSNQNLAQFDSNLDNLLEDLQNSVSRPGSSLGHSGTNSYSKSHTLDSGRSNSLNRITNVKSSNPVTEYSSDDAYSYSSPDGNKHVKGYKKESYMYKTSSNTLPTEKVRVQNSINQLDSLLDDLQQVKQSSTVSESYNKAGMDSSFQDGKLSSKKTVQRELHYGDTPRSSSRSRTLERTERESSVKRDAHYSSEGTYGDLRQIRTSSPSPSSRTSTLSKQTKLTNMQSYPLEVVETITPDINPEILAHLDPHLRPPGNTKVTTTIKTYTYEIPGSGDYPTNLTDTVDSDKYVYSLNQSQTTPSKSFVYSKVENTENILNEKPSWQNKVYHESSKTDNVINSSYTPYQKPSSPAFKETVTVRNYQPGYSPELSPPSNQSYVYNETVTTKNINNEYPRKTPPRQDTSYILKESHNTNTVSTVPYPEYRSNAPTTYVVKETHNTTNTTGPYPGDRGNPPRQDTYIVKDVTHNTTNRNYQNGYPPNEPNTVIYKHETHTTNTYGPGGRPGTPKDVESFDPRNPPYGKRPNEPVNINYKYKSTSTSTNNYRTGYPPRGGENEPLLRPFPTDNQVDAPAGGPPKKLDDLMATIGQEPPNSPYNAGFNAHEQELAHQRKVDTLKHQNEEVLQKKEPAPRTKNVSGPPVYYPPDHEMFSKKEESAGWRAEGAYGKESGKYKYEAEGGSKSKSRSGAAVVPVCLPLCCGLPCVIL